MIDYDQKAPENKLLKGDNVSHFSYSETRKVIRLYLALTAL